MKCHQPDFLLKCRRYALVASLWLLLFSAAIVGKSQAANLPIFFQNFDGGGFVTAPTTGSMTGYVNTQSVEGFAGLGTGTNVVSGLYLHNATGDNFTNSPSLKSTIQLSNLPAHSAIQLQFLLAIIDTWDGTSATFFMSMWMGQASSKRPFTTVQVQMFNRTLRRSVTRSSIM